MLSFSKRCLHSSIRATLHFEAVWKFVTSAKWRASWSKQWRPSVDGNCRHPACGWNAQWRLCSASLSDDPISPFTCYRFTWTMFFLSSLCLIGNVWFILFESHEKLRGSGQISFIEFWNVKCTCTREEWNISAVCKTLHELELCDLYTWPSSVMVVK
jgi:hypothetical protein